MSRILVVGTGYVGLTSAVGFAALGHRVTGLDSNPELVQSLSAGEISIHEPRMREMLGKSLETGDIDFVSSPSDLSERFQFIFMCVPTPENEDGSADLHFVFEATQSVRHFLLEGAVLVMKSTVPVGTASKIKSLLPKGVELISNPEFLREGQAIEDFNHPERIVIGLTNKDSAQGIIELYRSFNCPVLVTTNDTAELIKYAANAFLAIKLSYINELAFLSEKLQVNVRDLQTGLGLDSRIGPKHLCPGPGWGGSCFPKDTAALIKTGQEAGVELSIVKAAVSSNQTTIRSIALKASSLVRMPAKGKKICLLGLAFKAETGDTRESPAAPIAKYLLEMGFEVVGFDPVVQKWDEFPGVISNSLDDALRSSSLAILLVDWPEFGHLPPELFETLMNVPVLYDTRDVSQFYQWPHSLLKIHSHGFTD